MKNWPLALWSCSLYNPWWFNFFLGLKFWTPAYFNFSLSCIHFLSTEQKIYDNKIRTTKQQILLATLQSFSVASVVSFRFNHVNRIVYLLGVVILSGACIGVCFCFLTTERIPYSNLSIYIAFVIRILGKTCPSFSNLINIKQLLVYMHVWLSFDCFPRSSNQNTALTTLQQQQQQKVLEQQLLILSNSPFGDSPLFRNSLLVNIQRIK